VIRFVPSIPVVILLDHLLSLPYAITSLAFAMLRTTTHNVVVQVDVPRAMVIIRVVEMSHKFKPVLFRREQYSLAQRYLQ
jgi:hypothetical protein